MAQIKVDGLDKSFGTFHAVKGASFTVEDGQFLCLLGPSGCGKTTTLRMIAGLELPTAGTIRLGGEEVTMNRASARDIAFVFQLFALYPHMNVRRDRKSTRLNSSHLGISYAVFCLKKKMRLSAMERNWWWKMSSPQRQSRPPFPGATALCQSSQRTRASSVSRPHCLYCFR